MTIYLFLFFQADDPHGFGAVHKKCQADPATHIDDAVLDDIRKHHEKATEYPDYAKHIICMCKGLNLITHDGKINVEGVKTHVGHVVQETSKVEEIVKECAVEKGTETETTEHVWRCLHKNHIFEGHRHHHGSDESGSHESDEHQHHHDHQHHH